MDKKDFAITPLDIDNKIFIVHVAIQKCEKIPVHSKKQA